MNVRWLSREDIASSARRLLDEYETRLGRPVEPPIPVEDIVERHLGLTLAYEDLEEKLGVAGVLGATWVKSRRISLHLPAQGGPSEGRLAFTCAHEVGHWVLHRLYVEAAPRFQGGAAPVICRSRDARRPIEWQADYFAACLLMPGERVAEAFEAACGSRSLMLRNVKRRIRGTSLLIEPCVENWPHIAERVAGEGGFDNVSRQAMVIRLQELGLLVNLTGTPMAW